ncbi:MAG: hypothetical protein V4463_25255 [Pseudomonadota bacterium]
MKSLLCIAAVAAGLSGCASTEPLATQEPVLSAAGTPLPKDYTITGSRIPQTKSEKMVSQIGGKDYQEGNQGKVAPLQVH